jgi:hypothetical protein
MGQPVSWEGSDPIPEYHFQLHPAPPGREAFLQVAAPRNLRLMPFGRLSNEGAFRVTVH